MEEEPTYQLSVLNPRRRWPVSEHSLLDAMAAALRRHRATGARVNLALVDDPEISRLHELHLRQKGPTDVLTFDLRDSVAAKSTIDGEIVASVDTAEREAFRRGHPLDAELSLYAVHGILHLLGYNDQTEEGAADMHRVEDEILTSLGVGPVYTS